MSRSCHLKRGQNEKGAGGKETSREAAEDTLVNPNRQRPLLNSLHHCLHCDWPKSARQTSVSLVGCCPTHSSIKPLQLMESSYMSIPHLKILTQT